MRRAALAVAIAVAASGCKKKPRPAPCPPSISVRIGYPGASPELVEASVVIPVERAIAALPIATAVHALARDGEAVLEVEVSGDPDRAARLVFASLERIASLPEGVEVPVVMPVAALERIIVGVGPTEPAAALAVEQAIERMVGVSSVRAFGVDSPEIHINVDPSKLAAFDIDADRVAAAIRPAPSKAGNLGELVLRAEPVVQLGDIATITETIAERPAAFFGGARVAVFVIAIRDTPPRSEALASAGLTRASRPIRVSSCPRGLPRRFDVASAVAAGSGGEIARGVAGLPAVVLDGVDLSDRGVDGVEIIAIDDGAEVGDGLRRTPGVRLLEPATVAEIELTAESAAELLAAARAVAAAVAGIDGVTSLESVPPLEVRPEIRVEPDRGAAIRHGLDAGEIARAVQRAQVGEVAAIIRRARVAVPVRVFVGERGSDVSSVVVPTAGGVVPLSAVAKWVAVESREIYRRDRRRRWRLRIGVADATVLGRLDPVVQRSVAGMEVSITSDDASTSR